MRIMGLDYGTKTVGVAISDPLGITAQAVETIERKTENKLRQTLARIETLAKEYEVEKFQNVNDNLKSESERAFGISVLNMPAMQFVMYGTILGIFLIGGRLIHEGQMHLPFPMCCQAF